MWRMLNRKYLCLKLQTKFVWNFEVNPHFQGQATQCLRLVWILSNIMIYRNQRWPSYTGSGHAIAFISQSSRVDVIAMKFQRMYLCFQGPATWLYKCGILSDIRVSRKGNHRWLLSPGVSEVDMNLVTFISAWIHGMSECKLKLPLNTGRVLNLVISNIS